MDDPILDEMPEAYISRPVTELPEDICCYCGGAGTDHKHANGDRCCGNCCGIHGSLAHSDKPAYDLMKIMLHRIHDLHAQVVSAQSKYASYRMEAVKEYAKYEEQAAVKDARIAELLAIGKAYLYPKTSSSSS